MLLESWLEGMGPHSAGIGTTATPYLGLHICLDSIARLFDHDQGLLVLQGTAVKLSQKTSVLLSHYQPVGVCFNA